MPRQDDAVESVIPSQRLHTQDEHKLLHGREIAIDGGVKYTEASGQRGKAQNPKTDAGPPSAHWAFLSLITPSTSRPHATGDNKIFAMALSAQATRNRPLIWLLDDLRIGMPSHPMLSISCAVLRTRDNQRNIARSALRYTP